jgi:hypothetical protein
MSQYENRPNTGKLMKTKEKKYDKSPDMWGEIHVDRDYLLQLLEESDGLVTIKIEAWKNVSAAGNAYLGITVNTWKPDGQQARPATQEEKDPWDD